MTTTVPDIKELTEVVDRDLYQHAITIANHIMTTHIAHLIKWNNHSYCDKECMKCGLAFFPDRIPERERKMIAAILREKGLRVTTNSGPFSEYEIPKQESSE